MATKISNLKENNDKVYPITKVECVYNDNNQTVSDLLLLKQDNLPTTNTAGQVLKSTTTAGTVQWGPVIESENTAYNKNFETSTSNIKMDGTASVGSLDTVARADHTHPSDTTKANAQNVAASSSGYKFPTYTNQGVINGVAATAYQRTLNRNGSSLGVFYSTASSTINLYGATSQLSTSTAKRYLIGSSSTTSLATQSSNASVYMENGKLYSDSKEVATTDQIPIVPSNIESTDNKVTSISSSSTDTQYPSAKCVYDLVGNIDTLLIALNTGSGV